MRFCLLLCSFTLLWLAPSVAAACGATPPSFTLLTDAAGQVPAGTRVLKVYVYGTVIDPASAKVSLNADARGGSQPVAIPVTVRSVVLPLLEVDLGGASIQADVRYTLSVAGAESEVEGNVGFDAKLPFAGVAASPLPSELGALALQSRRSGTFSAGGCGEGLLGEEALIKLMPSSAAEPWLRAISHQVFVDGLAQFEPELPLVDYVARVNPTTIRALARCGLPASAERQQHAPGIELRLSPGKHSIKWTSTLANGTVLETTALDVDLSCGGGSTPVTPPCCKPLVGPADAGAGTATGVNPTMVAPGPPSVAPSANANANASEAGIAAADSGASPGRTNSLIVDDGAGSSLGEDEGCALAGTRRDASPWALLLALVMLHARRARRTPSTLASRREARRS